MALSVRFGIPSEEPSEEEIEEFNNNVRPYFNEFRDWFIAEFGSVVCWDILYRQFGRYFNFMDPNELQEFKDFGGQREKCAEVYAPAAVKAAEILTEMLSREDKP